jgi:hypothetical protein
LDHRFAEISDSEKPKATTPFRNGAECRAARGSVVGAESTVLMKKHATLDRTLALALPVPGPLDILLPPEKVSDHEASATGAKQQTGLSAKLKTRLE